MFNYYQYFLFIIEFEHYLSYSKMRDLIQVEIISEIIRESNHLKDLNNYILYSC